MVPNKSEQGLVVFHLWPGLAYGLRMLCALGLVAAGFGVQYMSLAAFPGILLVLAGNLLLLVKGYDNRIKAGSYDASAAWQQVEVTRLFEIVARNKRIAAWDRSAFDITSGLGVFVGLVLVIGLCVAVARCAMPVMNLVLWDALALLAPHWVTGVRRILTVPGLITKIEMIKAVLGRTKLQGGSVEYYMLLKGDKAKMPDDVKIRVTFANQHKDFLGLYGQITTNSVQGTLYPYFYIVLVAKQGFGLFSVHESYTPPKGVIKEFSRKDDVEVLVVRQTTTSTSGYNTTSDKAALIFAEGVGLAAHHAAGIRQPQSAQAPAAA